GNLVRVVAEAVARVSRAGLRPLERQHADNLKAPLEEARLAGPGQRPVPSSWIAELLNPVVMPGALTRGLDGPIRTTTQPRWELTASGGQGTSAGRSRLRRRASAVAGRRHYHPVHDHGQGFVLARRHVAPSAALGASFELILCSDEPRPPVVSPIC